MPHELEAGDLSHLLHALGAILHEHRGCGELDGGADDENGLRLVCECDASIRRTLASVDFYPPA